MPASSFKGGIYPPKYKEFTQDREFLNLAIPQICYIPLQQHTGKPALPRVQVGDTVQEGQLIGGADGFISANVHASIPGKVIEIGEYPTVYSKKGTCVVIEAEGNFSAAGSAPDESWEHKGKEDLLNIIREAGIVGLGGAAFPTHVKLSPPENKKIDTLIINGAECEPYLTVDDLLMRSFAGPIIEGTRIALRILGIDRAVIGIEDNKKKAIAALKSTLAGSSFRENIQVKTLKTKYPQGAEKQLICSILKREVPSGGLPMDAGVVVQNVGTIHAIHQAVLERRPLFERYITVSGKIVNNPGNYKVRIGTRISHIIEECGGLKEHPAKIIMGGPMCGIALDSMDIPVVKGTSGILFLSKREVPVAEYHPCIRCGRCIRICPSGLLPNMLGNAMEKDRKDLLENLRPFDCIMCGSCTFVCPSRRPLNHFIKIAQGKLRAAKSA